MPKDGTRPLILGLNAVPEDLSRLIEQRQEMPNNARRHGMHVPSDLRGIAVPSADERYLQLHPERS